MNEKDEIFLSKWAIIVGFIIGGLPFYFGILREIKSKSYEVFLILVGPIVMAFLMPKMTSYMLKACGRDGLNLKRKITSGIILALSYTYITLTIFAISDWIAFASWGFIVFLFGTLLSVLVGSALGVIYGKYIENVFREKTILKHDILLLGVFATIAFVLYFAIPGTLWIVW